MSIMQKKQNKENQHDRQLEGGDFMDSPAISLSWRYLGVYIDSNDSNQRKVLWAAYRDPDYEGQGVAEYSFYERSTGRWDTSTCYPETYGLNFPGTRCERLNCHEAGTKLELVGVYKETDGLYDWTEQLFKHQGYCLWDGDKDNDDGWAKTGGTSDYEFMHKMSEKWVRGCKEIYVNGNLLYYDTKPLPGGDMTYGVYTDYECSVESKKIKWSGVLASYSDNGDNANNLPSMEALDRWNDLLSDYKICQPCRAYNKVQIDSPEQYSDEDFEDGEDGAGGKDPWGFNCYDDAGYQNCFQCYKFASHTRMEEASSDDLELATSQGTILGITIDGISYGKGQFAVSRRGSAAGKIFKIFGFLVLIVLCALLLAASARRARLRARRRAKSRHARDTRRKRTKKKINNPSLEESMLDRRQRSRSRSSKRERSRSKSSRRSLKLELI